MESDTTQTVKASLASQLMSAKASLYALLHDMSGKSSTLNLFLRVFQSRCTCYRMVTAFYSLNQ